MSTQALILTGIAIYVVAMLAIGVYTSRAAHTIVDFAVAGRHLPLSICSASIFATWFGTGIMMGAATSGYERNMLAMIAEPFGSALALFLSGLLFARLYRRSRRMTWMEFFEARYGIVASVIGAFADILANIIWLGGVLFTIGVLLQSLAGIPATYGILGGVAVVVIYTMFGGMWAVALTDLVQGIILSLGLVLLLGVVWVDVGGWSAIASQLPAHTLRAIPSEHSVINWVEWVHVWLVMGVAAIASTSIIQRSLSARDEKVAQNSFYIASAGYLVIGAIPLVLGLIASVTLPGLDDPNSVLTELAVQHFHPLLVVLFVGAIVSAIMSTSDSVLLAVGTVASTNFLPLVVRHPSDRLRLLVARYSMPFTALLACYVALNADRVVQVLIDASAVLLAAIIVPFVACFWWEKANPAGAMAALLSGMTTWLVCEAVETAWPPDLLGFLVSLVAMVSVTLLTQTSHPPRPLTDDAGRPLALDNRLGVL